MSYLTVLDESENFINQHLFHMDETADYPWRLADSEILENAKIQLSNLNRYSLDMLAPGAQQAKFLWILAALYFLSGYHERAEIPLLMYCDFYQNNLRKFLGLLPEKEAEVHEESKCFIRSILLLAALNEKNGCYEDAEYYYNKALSLPYCDSLTLKNEIKKKLVFFSMKNQQSKIQR